MRPVSPLLELPELPLDEAEPPLDPDEEPDDEEDDEDDEGAGEEDADPPTGSALRDDDARVTVGVESVEPVSRV